MSDPKPFFPGIHALRAVAATFVVIQHAGFAAKDYFVFGYDIDTDYFIWGRIGVVVFFAISGFVIALQRTKPVGLFIVHRMLRIYPAYWLALAISAIAFTLAGLQISAGPAAILLYPGTKSEGGMWIPYWSLAFEMAFYALAALAFGLRLSDRTLTVIALLWIVAVNLFAPDPRGSDEYAFPGAWILLSSAAQVFPMGLICGIHFERLRRAGRWPYVVACAIAYAGSFMFAELSVAKLLLLGLTSCCLILAIADFDMRSRVVTLFGNASYGIYLLHFPALMLTAAIAPSISFLWFFAIGMAGGTLFGMLDHYLYRRLSRTVPHLPRLSVQP